MIFEDGLGRMGGELMFKAGLIVLSAMVFVPSVEARDRVRADPWALDPPIVRQPSGSSNLSRPSATSTYPRYPGRLRNYNNPRAEYGIVNPRFRARRR